MHDHRLLEHREVVGHRGAADLERPGKGRRLEDAAALAQQQFDESLERAPALETSSDTSFAQ
jgi:hypothetical protein